MLWLVLMILALLRKGSGVFRTPWTLQKSHFSPRIADCSAFVAKSVGGGASQTLPPPCSVLVCVWGGRIPGGLHIGTMQEAMKTS